MKRTVLPHFLCLLSICLTGFDQPDRPKTKNLKSIPLPSNLLSPSKDQMKKLVKYLLTHNPIKIDPLAENPEPPMSQFEDQKLDAGHSVLTLIYQKGASNQYEYYFLSRDAELQVYFLFSAAGNPQNLSIQKLKENNYRIFIERYQLGGRFDGTPYLNVIDIDSSSKKMTAFLGSYFLDRSKKNKTDVVWDDVKYSDAGPEEHHYWLLHWNGLIWVKTKLEKTPTSPQRD